MDGVSKIVIWRARILSVLDEYDIKNHVENVLDELAGLHPLNKFNKNQARAKHLIMDGVKDHVVQHIAGENAANEMWTALETMYQGSFVQRKMLLEN